MSNVTISKFSDGINIGYIAPQSYFECSTAAATAAKTATSPDSVVFSNTSLSRGTTVFVKFTNENTADSPTLQIGTSTAKSISGSATWSAGSVVSFTYDGTNWIQGSGDSSGSGDGPVVVTADISNNPQLFQQLMLFLGTTDEITPWTSTTSSALISALESDASAKFTDIITNSKQGIFRIKFKNTTAGADVELNFLLDTHLTINSSTIYTITGQLGSTNLNQTYPRTYYVRIRVETNTSPATVDSINLSTSNAEELIAAGFSYNYSGGDIPYQLKLSCGGTGLADIIANSWYDSTVLHPHFEVSTNGLTFNCYYVGPLPDTVSSVSDALACDEVKYALKQPVPVYDTVSGLQGFAGLANITEINNSTGLKVIFADALTFYTMVVNGIQGVLVYDGTENYPLYLDSVTVNIPWYVNTSSNSLKILQNAVGDVSIGSTTQPIYWTGSAFTPVSGGSSDVLNIVSGTTTYGDIIDAYTAGKVIQYRPSGTETDLGRVFYLQQYNIVIVGTNIMGTVSVATLGSISYGSPAVTTAGYIDLFWTLSGTRDSTISASSATRTVVPLVNLDNV